MPIVNRPVEPFVQPPFRNKLDKAGGLRLPEDWQDVIIHFQGNNKHFICHDMDSYDSVVVEIHDCQSVNGEQELEFCRMECFELTREQRMELAIYLLGTV